MDILTAIQANLLSPAVLFFVLGLIAATNYLKAIDQPFENYATAFLAVMEAPTILVGVVLGKMALKKSGESSNASLRTAVHEALFGV